MLKYPKMAMNPKWEVTTICKGEHRIWNDREDAKTFFLEMMRLRMVRNMNVRSVFLFRS